MAVPGTAAYNEKIAHRARKRADRAGYGNLAFGALGLLGNIGMKAYSKAKDLDQQEEFLEGLQKGLSTNVAPTHPAAGMTLPPALGPQGPGTGQTAASMAQHVPSYSQVMQHLPQRNPYTTRFAMNNAQLAMGGGSNAISAKQAFDMQLALRRDARDASRAAREAADHALKQDQDAYRIHSEPYVNDIVTNLHDPRSIEEAFRGISTGYQAAGHIPHPGSEAQSLSEILKSKGLTREAHDARVKDLSAQINSALDDLSLLPTRVTDRVRLNKDMGMNMAVLQALDLPAGVQSKLKTIQESMLDQALPDSAINQMLQEFRGVLKPALLGRRLELMAKRKLLNQGKSQRGGYQNYAYLPDDVRAALATQAQWVQQRSQMGPHLPQPAPRPVLKAGEQIFGNRANLDAWLQYRFSDPMWDTTKALTGHHAPVAKGSGVQPPALTESERAENLAAVLRELMNLEG